jgi:hypothetical protein
MSWAEVLLVPGSTGFLAGLLVVATRLESWIADSDPESDLVPVVPVGAE